MRINWLHSVLHMHEFCHLLRKPHEEKKKSQSEEEEEYGFWAKCWDAFRTLHLARSICVFTPNWCMCIVLQRRIYPENSHWFFGSKKKKIYKQSMQTRKTNKDEEMKANKIHSLLGLDGRYPDGPWQTRSRRYSIFSSGSLCILFRRFESETLKSNCKVPKFIFSHL